MNAKVSPQTQDAIVAKESLATIVVKEPSGYPRVREPICVGVPVRLERVQGEVHSNANPGKLLLVDSLRRIIPATFEPLQFMSTDRQFQWFLVKFLCDCRSHEELFYSVVEGQTTFRSVDLAPMTDTASFKHHRDEVANAVDGGMVIELSDSLTVKIDLRVKVLGAKEKSVQLRRSTKTEGRKSVLGPPGISKSHIFTGNTNGLTIELKIDCWDDASLAKLELVVHNPRRAEHANGFWDLGDPQSILVESIEVLFSIDQLVQGQERIVRWQRNPGEKIDLTKKSRWSLRQLGSGGANWNSRNHVDRFGNVCITEHGFVESSGGDILSGSRVSPWLSVGSEERQLAFFAPKFWETFPNGFRVERDSCIWELLPKQSYSHEIQPGEQLAKSLWIEVNQPYRNGICRSRGLRNPLVARPLIRDDHSVPAPLAVCSNTSYPSSVESYLASIFSDTEGFKAKREVIDEFGWRNFGDVWADHEMAYADCCPPIISHYNNQYDLLLGFLNEFIRRGESTVRDLASDLANHVVRIDTYRTECDRASYNNGLFWHTAHYRDALTSSHRCYSKGMINGKHRSLGGGLSNEHTYTNGLLLFYLLSGESIYRDTVLRLGDRVIAMDDGDQHWLAPFSNARTGEASSTAMEGYHGPGRGCGNSLNALIDCWCLSEDEKYIRKGEELLRRMMHPNDDIGRFDLGNAELRWSYTVAIQAMLRWIILVPDSNGTHGYVRSCLSSLGAWMLQNERQYLDSPESLEFPTETWAAQELRKANCMISIGMMESSEALGTALLEKGKKHFSDAWERLLGFDSCRLTRPSAIILQQVPHRYGVQKLHVFPCESLCTLETEVAVPFRTQKEEVRELARNPLGISRMLLRASIRPQRFLPMILESQIGRLFRMCKKVF